jgi:hypothetical protein
MKFRWTKFRVGVAMVSAFLACSAVLALVHVDRWALYRHDISQNTWIDFYGQVVDAQGKPIDGAVVEAGTEGYNLFYLFGGARGTSRKLRAITDKDGRFSFRRCYGDGLGVTAISKDGYQWLYGTQAEVGDNVSFTYHPEPYYSYVPDPERPAIFPMVKPGERTNVLPSRGGWERGFDGSRKPNRPVVPYRPSVPDAVPTPKK